LAAVDPVGGVERAVVGRLLDMETFLNKVHGMSCRWFWARRAGEGVLWLMGVAWWAGAGWHGVCWLACTGGPCVQRRGAVYTC